MPKYKQDEHVVRKTGHEAAFRKIRCTNCHTDYAVGDGQSGYKCPRCGTAYRSKKL